MSDMTAELAGGQVEPHWTGVDPLEGAEGFAIVYVTPEDLAEALGHGGVPERWRGLSDRIDAYVVRHDDGDFTAGIRFGPSDRDCINIVCMSEPRSSFGILASRYGNHDAGAAFGR